MRQIRKASASDAQAIFDLRNAAIRAESAASYPAEIIQRWTTGDTPSAAFIDFVAASFYVIEADDEIGASGALDLVSGKIDAIFVHPMHQRQGYGREMLRFLEQLALQAGLAELQLESTLNAVAFYRKAGFVGREVSTYESPRGFSMDCVLMRKQLALAPPPA